MIEKIHLDTKLDKCLAALKKRSRRANLAANRVETIIAELKRGAMPPGQICTFTRNGEARIKGCRKYNLGAGYRLITLKQESDLYLLFVGTHDECGRWIENNREHLPLKEIAERCRTLKRSTGKKEAPAAPSPPPDPEPETDQIPPLKDVELRTIFSGLTGNKFPPVSS